MKKQWIFVWLLGALFFLLPTCALAEASEITVTDDASLTQALKTAQSGDVILLQDGLYHGPLNIETSITLKGKGKAKIQGAKTGNVITVKADHTAIENLQISGGGTQNAGIFITANSSTIRHNIITNVFHGIQTQRSYGHLIEENTISSFVDDPSQFKGYGIYLHETEQSKVINNFTSWTQDGIYNSFSNLNEITNNHITQARYGVHTMDSKNVIISGNIVSKSHIGSMIMQSQFLTVQGNHFYDNTTVDGVGMFIFDSFDSQFLHNVIENNHEGIELQNDSRNEFHYNDLAMNDIGMVIGDKSNSNVISLNNFKKNINQVVTSKDNNNLFEEDEKGNYWDDQNHLDLDGDGIVDYSYRSGSAFYQVAAVEPNLQLFFESPAAQLWNLIEKYTQLPSDKFIVDAHPLNQELTIAVSDQKDELSHHKQVFQGYVNMLVFGFAFCMTFYQLWITRRRYK